MSVTSLPALRFPDFDGVWTAEPLINLLSTFETGVSVNSEDRRSSPGEVGVLKTSAVRSGVFYPDENKVIVRQEVSRARTTPRAGSILVSRINTLDRVGESGFVREDRPDLFLPDRLWQLGVDDGRVIGEWLATYLSIDRVRKRIARSASGTSGTMKNVSKESFGALIVAHPELPEQRAIVDFLGTIDQWVGLIRSRIVMLGRLAEGFATRLLGDQSSLTEPTALSDVLSVRGETRQGQAIDEVFSVARHAGVINQIEHLGRDYSAANLARYKVVRPGDVIYTKSPTAGFPYGIVKQNRTGRTGLVSPLYAVCVPSTAAVGSLVEHYFSSPVRTINYLAPVVTKGAKNTINVTDEGFLTGKPLLLPLSEPDRNQVAGVLDALNDRVRLERERLELAIRYRRGLIESMFV